MTFANSIIFVLLFLFFIPVDAQGFKTSNPAAFKRGEELVYRIFFDSRLTGEIDAGLAHMIITDEKREFVGHQSYHMIAKGVTVGAINLFFKVKDRFESYIDESSLLPYLFIRKAYESGYTADEHTTFDRKNKQAHFVNNKKNTKEIIPISEDVHDIISAYYFARTIEIEHLGQNDKLQMKFMFEDSIYITDIYFEGKEKVSTLLGDFNCLKFKPKVIVGNVFDEDFPLTVWITDDKNRIPLVVESKIIVGFVKLELFSYKNLANPLDSFIKN